MLKHDVTFLAQVFIGAETLVIYKNRMLSGVFIENGAMECCVGFPGTVYCKKTTIQFASYKSIFEPHE